MGTKRSIGDVDSSATGRDGVESRHRFKKPKIKQLKRKEESLSWVKKRARDIERRFQQDNSKLPANVMNDLERELAAHRARLDEEKYKKLRSKMISKYHMVRFFERKKATRLAKRLRNQIGKATDPDEIASLKVNLHVAEVDVNYSIYCPLMEPYISIYPPAAADKTEDHGIAQLALHSERPPLWKTVEKAMEEGQEALQKLRERRLDVDSEDQGPSGRISGQTQRPKTKKPSGDRAGASAGGQRNDTAGAEQNGNSESDDGGFFED